MKNKYIPIWITAITFIILVILYHFTVYEKFVNEVEYEKCLSSINCHKYLTEVAKHVDFNSMKLTEDQLGIIKSMDAHLEANKEQGQCNPIGCSMSKTTKQDNFKLSGPCSQYGANDYGNGDCVFYFENNNEGIRNDAGTQRINLTKFAAFTKTAYESKNEAYLKEKAQREATIESNKITINNQTNSISELTSQQSQLTGKRNSLQSQASTLDQQIAAAQAMNDSLKSQSATLSSINYGNSSAIDSAINNSGNRVNVLGPPGMAPWFASSFIDRSAQWIWNIQSAAADAPLTPMVNFHVYYENKTNSTMSIKIYAIIDNYGWVNVNDQRIGDVAGAGWLNGGVNATIFQTNLKPGVNKITFVSGNQGGPAGLLATARVEANIPGLNSGTTIFRTGQDTDQYKWRWTT